MKNAATERRATTSTRAFTLIELLVVTAILAVVVSAVGACLAGGLRVWDVARRFNRDEADALMGFQIMRRDMGRTLPVEWAPFEGEPDGVRLVGVTVVPGAEGRDEAVMRLAQVRYFLDRDRHAWCRAVASVEADAEAADEAIEVIVTDVESVTLRYAAAPEDDEAVGSSVWLDDWENPTNLPAVVEMELVAGDTAMTQWFLIPLAGGGAE